MVTAYTLGFYKNEEAVLKDLQRCAPTFIYDTLEEAKEVITLSECMSVSKMYKITIEEVPNDAST